MPENPAPPDLIKCACCGEPTKSVGFDIALQGAVGHCCRLDLKIAKLNLTKAGFLNVTLNPAHEK